MIFRANERWIKIVKNKRKKLFFRNICTDYEDGPLKLEVGIDNILIPKTVRNVPQQVLKLYHDLPRHVLHCC